MAVPDAQTTFMRWFDTPLRALECLSNADGGMVVAIACCPLYERLAAARLKADPALKGMVLTDLLAMDFKLRGEDAEVIWDVWRNGFLHGAMGLAKTRDGVLPAWEMHHKYPALAVGPGSNGSTVVQIQPWRLRDRILDLWRVHIHLLEANTSFPWAKIWFAPA